MYGCPGCGSMMTFDIPSQQLKCTRCDRTMSIEEADQREARTAGSSFSVDLLTCPTCGAELRTMNTAAASFCSYCGSSVMLNRKESSMEAPDTIAPFQVTREQCFEEYQKTLKKSICADHRLKSGISPESFRAIYVPYYEYSAEVSGSTTLEGSYTRGDKTYYYKTDVNLDHSYEHILHDASSEMPDAMSEKISRVDPSAFRPFSPAYISGFYADSPDRDPSEYTTFARAEAVRNGLTDVLKDIDDECTYSTGEAEKKLINLATAEHKGTTLIPTWFMSIKNGNRVLYAVQNGVTGEMTADIPLDIPRFAIFVLLLAVPIFFLLNAFLTLRPEMVMVAAMGLSLVAQLIINYRKALISDHESGVKSIEENRTDIHAALKLRKRLASSSRGSGIQGILPELGGIGGVLIMIAGMYVVSRMDNIRIFHLASAVLTIGMACAILAGKKKNVKTPLGSFVSLVAMIAGCVILILDVFHSADTPIYIVSFLCLAAVIWESVDLLLLYNRNCSNPLPQFETHQGGENYA